VNRCISKDCALPAAFELLFASSKPPTLPSQFYYISYKLAWQRHMVLLRQSHHSLQPNSPNALPCQSLYPSCHFSPFPLLLSLHLHQRCQPPLLSSPSPTKEWLMRPPPQRTTAGHWSPPLTVHSRDGVVDMGWGSSWELRRLPCQFNDIRGKSLISYHIYL